MVTSIIGCSGFLVRMRARSSSVGLPEHSHTRPADQYGKSANLLFSSPAAISTRKHAAILPVVDDGTLWPKLLPVNEHVCIFRLVPICQETLEFL